jgi:hypothetical protein
MVHSQQHAVYSCKWDQGSQSLGHIDLLHGLDPQQHTPFSPELYSKFKYGSSTASQHYALDIYRAVQLLFRHELNHVDATNLVLTSAAYKCMPTASTALFADVLSLINNDRHVKNLSPIPNIKIHRKNILNKDYGLLTHEGRAKAMKCTQLDINITDTANNNKDESSTTAVVASDVTNYLHGKHIVIIDDCIITGAHMNCIINHFNNTLGLGDDVQLTFLFILSVQSNITNTPDPSTTAAENYLNHYYVTSLDRWLEMVNSDHVGPVNGRMVKYFLTSMVGMKKKCTILNQLRHEAVLQMYHGAIADDIASSFTEQMEAIERQIGINESKTTTTTTTTTHLMRKVSEETLGDGTTEQVM